MEKMEFVEIVQTESGKFSFVCNFLRLLRRQSLRPTGTSFMRDNFSPHQEKPLPCVQRDSHKCKAKFGRNWFLNIILLLKFFSHIFENLPKKLQSCIFLRSNCFCRYDESTCEVCCLWNRNRRF